MNYLYLSLTLLPVTFFVRESANLPNKVIIDLTNKTADSLCLSKDTQVVNDTSKLFDVVFNEIMADPSPVAGLPDVEYIELYNRNVTTVNLNGWKLSVGTSVFTFSDVDLPGNGYLTIASKTDAAKLQSFGSVIGLFSSSSALNNTGQHLTLVNSFGCLIAWVEYDDSWYGDDFKAQGGYSLEQIDPSNPCGGKTNWKASIARSGGTPCSKNSVNNSNSDTSLPTLYHINIPTDSIIELYFNESIDSIIATDRKSYYISPIIGSPGKVEMLNRNFTAVKLMLSFPIAPHQSYSLKISKDITDCIGNKMTRETYTSIGLPVTPDAESIIINEVLFNAYPGGTDYVELYNRTDHFFNSRQLLMGIKTSTQTENLCRLSETGFLILPYSYLLFCENKEKVKSFYLTGEDKNIIELTQMPALDDKAATIVLLNDSFATIDQFSYNEKMHLSELKSMEGVSLERLNPDKNASFPGNWHSASETAGFGTPGYKNSQFITDSVQTNQIEITNQIFSPNNDGYDDLLQVSYGFDQPGCRAQVYIFDARGRLVRRLLNNELLGTTGSFTWDGTNDSGALCPIGAYVMFIRTVFDDGLVKEYKKGCVLTKYQ
jgi:hypothetical protein